MRGKMEESFDAHRPQRIHQQISVPFTWEDKPGRPKREWTPTVTPPTSLPSSPLPSYVISSPSTLVASIPFEWEEKPGKPLDQFHYPWLIRSPPFQDTSFVGTPVRSNNPFISNEEEAHEFDSYIKSSASGKEEGSYVSAPSSGSKSSLLQGSQGENTPGHCEAWGSSDKESEVDDSSSSSSSSNDGKFSVDAPVMEALFPLAAPDAGFLSKTCCYLEGGDPTVYPEFLTGSGKGNCSLVARRTFTLGELILLSRKLSCARRNPIREEKQGNFSVDFMKKVFACF